MSTLISRILAEKLGKTPSNGVNQIYKYNLILKLAHININGLRNKPDEVKQILNCKLFDMLFISETKIDNTI